MKICITTDKKNEISRNLEEGLKDLGHEVKFVEVPPNTTYNFTLQEVESFDFVHDFTGQFFNGIKNAGMRKALYHVVSYYPQTEHKSPLVALSRRHAILLEHVSLGLDPEPAPSYYETNRFMHYVSPYYVYPDIKIKDDQMETNGSKKAFLFGLSDKELDEKWEKHLESLLKTTDILCLQQEPPQILKKYNPRIINSLDEYRKLLKNDYNTIIYWTTTHIPFPVMLLEALALQCKVISTSYGGIPELITHGKNGYIANNLSSIEYALGHSLQKDNIKVPQACIYPSMARNFVSLYNHINDKRTCLPEYTLVGVF